MRLRWERILQPWLLQDYTGTSGLRVERMLTRLVAEKFKDHRGINWSELVREHKEFAGHTGASIGHIFWSCRNSALRCKKKSSVSLQEVAEHTADVYQPGKERKETETKEMKRRKWEDEEHRVRKGMGRFLCQRKERGGSLISEVEIPISD